MRSPTDNAAGRTEQYRDPEPISQSKSGNTRKSGAEVEKKIFNRKVEGEISKLVKRITVQLKSLKAYY